HDLLDPHSIPTRRSSDLYPARCPGRLEIEPARNAVNIEYFAGKIEIGAVFALHSPHIDLIERDAAAGHKLIFIGSFALDIIAGIDRKSTRLNSSHVSISY